MRLQSYEVLKAALDGYTSETVLASHGGRKLVALVTFRERRAPEVCYEVRQGKEPLKQTLFLDLAMRAYAGDEP